MPENKNYYERNDLGEIMESKRKELLERFKSDLLKAQSDVNQLQQALQQANAQVFAIQGGIQALEMLGEGSEKP